MLYCSGPVRIIILNTYSVKIMEAASSGWCFWWRGDFNIWKTTVVFFFNHTFLYCSFIISRSLGMLRSGRQPQLEYSHSKKDYCQDDTNSVAKKAGDYDPQHDFSSHYFALKRHGHT